MPNVTSIHTILAIITILTSFACCMDISCPGAPKVPRSLARKRFSSRKCQVLKHFQFILAMEEHDIDSALRYLEDPNVDPSFEENLAIRVASENGLVQVVAKLLDDSRVDPSACNNYAIRNAGKLIDKFVVRRPPKISYSLDGVRANTSPISTGFGPKTSIMRLLMADPLVPFPSHLRKPSLNNPPPPLPLHLQINKPSLETIKMNDLEQYQVYLATMEASHFYFQNLDFACLMAYRHGYDRLFSLTLMKIFSMDEQILIRRGYPRLLRLKQWLELIYLFVCQADILSDIRFEVLGNFVYCSMKDSSRAYLDAS